MRFTRFLPLIVFLAACSSETTAPGSRSTNDIPEDDIPKDDGTDVEVLRQIPDSWDVVLLPEGLEGRLINSHGLVAGRRDGKNVLYDHRNGREWQLPDGQMIAVNDRDQVLINHEDRTYLWSKAGTLDLGSLNSGPTSAVDLNNTGHVAGMSGGTPFLWTPERGMRPLKGRGSPSAIIAMNGKDQIVGAVWSGGIGMIVVWSSNGSTRTVSEAGEVPCPPPFPSTTTNCGLGILGLDNRGVIGGIIGQSQSDSPDNTAGFVISRKGELEAFHGVGSPTIPTGYTDSGIMPMLSYSSTTPSVRLPDGRIRPLFHELSGQAYALAASFDGHILGFGNTFTELGFRFSVLVPRTAR